MTEKIKLNFEDALDELESIVASMEEGQLSLEDLVDKFERGTRLQQHCSDTLNQISTRIEKLKNNADASTSVEDSAATADEANDDDIDELLF